MAEQKPSAPVEEEGFGDLLKRAAKTVGIELPTRDVETFISLARHFLTPQTAATIVNIPKKEKILDDGECLDEPSVLHLIANIMKGEINVPDAIATLKTELKRQYKAQTEHQRRVNALRERANKTQLMIEKTKERIEEYRKKPPFDDDSRFDQYIDDLCKLSKLNKSFDEDRALMHKEKDLCTESPSIKRLEEALISLPNQ